MVFPVSRLTRYIPVGPSTFTSINSPFKTAHGVDGFSMNICDVKISGKCALRQVDGYLPECGVGEDFYLGV